MVDQSRRKYVLGAAAVASALAVYQALPLASLRNGIQVQSSQATEAFSYAYRSWLQQGLGEPSQYMQACQLYGKDCEAIKQSIVQDFKDRNTVSVDGLVLAKSEFALLAYLGELSLPA